MPMQGETREIVYRHPKGRFDVVERRGKGKLGGEYRIREAVYPRLTQRKPASEPEPIQTIKTVCITERDKVQFEKLYKQGYGIRQIAKISGWSDTTICSCLIQSGTIRRKSSQAIYQASEQDKAQFAELRRQGYTTAKIAAISGWSKATVFRYLKQMGLIREQRKLTDCDKAQIESLAQNGATGAQIAEIVGVSRKTVYRYLRSIGIRKRQI